MYRTTSRASAQIARRGNSICAIDETTPAVAKVPGSDARPLHRRTSLVLVPSVAPASVVAVTSEADPNPFENDPVAAAIYLLENDAFHLVAPEVQKWAAEQIALAAVHNTRNWASLSIESKASIARLTMEWYREPGDKLGRCCQSIHTGNIYYVQYLPNANKGEGRVVCNCQAKDDCYHKQVFNEKFLPGVLAYIAAQTGETGDRSEGESMHRQEMDAETEIASAGRRSCDIRRQTGAFVVNESKINYAGDF